MNRLSQTFGFNNKCWKEMEYYESSVLIAAVAPKQHLCQTCDNTPVESVLKQMFLPFAL